MDEQKARMLEKLENLTLEYLTQLAHGEAPEFKTESFLTPIPGTDENGDPNSGISLVDLLPDADSKRALARRGCRLQASTLRRHRKLWATANFAFKTLQSGRERTLRAAYYSRMDTFKAQYELDSTVNELASVLGVKRRMLGVVAAARGSVLGPIQFLRDGQVVADASSSPVIIDETLSDPDVRYETTARLCLIVEKEGILTHLRTTHFTSKFPVIVITGNGFPPYGVQLLAYRLCTELGLQPFGLFDCNPHGAAIMMRYRYGLSRVHDPAAAKRTRMCIGHADLAISTLRWIGMRHQDLEYLLSNSRADQSKGVDATLTGWEEENPSTASRRDSRIDELELTRLDRSVAAKVIEDAHTLGDKEIVTAVEKMLERGTKFEIQSVLNYRWDYLTEEFLPNQMLSASRADEE